MKDLHRAHDADHQLRPALQTLDARLLELGYPAYLFEQRFVYDAYHEFYADFVAALEARDPEVILRCEAISTGPAIAEDPAWRARSFAITTEAPSGRCAPHVALAAARAPAWAAAEASMPPLTRAAVLGVVRETILASLDHALVDGATDLRLQQDLGRESARFVRRLERALALTANPPRAPWRARLVGDLRRVTDG